jgi:hypothetical protein
MMNQAAIGTRWAIADEDAKEAISLSFLLLFGKFFWFYRRQELLLGQMRKG